MRTEQMGWNPNRDQREAGREEQQRKVTEIVSSLRRPLRVQRRSSYRWSDFHGAWVEVR